MSNVINKAQTTLSDISATEEQYESLLVELGPIVAQSAQSQEYRELLNTNEIKSNLIEIILDSFTPGRSYSTYYCRVFRGILLLLRNISSVQPENGPFYSTVLNSWDRADKSLQLNPTISSQLLVSYIQTLANLTTQEEQEIENIQQTYTVTTKYCSQIADLGPEAEFPFTLLLSNIAKNEGLSLLMKSPALVEYLIKQFHSVDTDLDLNHHHSVLLSLLQDLVSHEGYNNWLVTESQDFTLNFPQILQTSQLVVTSKSDWNNYEIAAMLAWIYDFFKIFSQRSQELLPSQNIDTQELSIVHKNLISTLDCISDLGKFEAAKQFLEHYHAMDELVALLRVIQDNVARQTLKKRKIEEINDQNTTREKKFPQVKSLIIEVISYMAHESPKMQDRVRELHGLELVLSNCMIDDNDPYIKERAIICIKILLENNQKNQQFVADLEAKQSVDDQALKDVGYEVEIEDGKVKLRKSAEQSSSD